MTSATRLRLDLPGRCGCGSSMMRIADIAGRRDDDFRYGERMVPASAFRHVLGTDPLISEYQVRQTAGGADVLGARVARCLRPTSAVISALRPYGLSNPEIRERRRADRASRTLDRQAQTVYPTQVTSSLLCGRPPPRQLRSRLPTPITCLRSTPTGAAAGPLPRRPRSSRLASGRRGAARSRRTRARRIRRAGRCADRDRTTRAPPHAPCRRDVLGDDIERFRRCRGPSRSAAGHVATPLLVGDRLGLRLSGAQLKCTCRCSLPRPPAVR